MARIRSKAWLTLMMVLALTFLVSSLIPSAAAAPTRRPHLSSKRDVGNQETVPLTLVQSTDVARLGIAPSPGSIGSNDPAEELFPPNHDFEQEMGSGHGGGPAPMAHPSPSFTHVNAYGGRASTTRTSGSPATATSSAWSRPTRPCASAASVRTVLRTGSRSSSP